MVVYPDGVTFGLVEDVNLFLIGEKHLVESLMRNTKEGMS